MSPVLNHFAFFEDDDAVGVSNGREAVCDDNGGSVSRNSFDGSLECRFSLVVHR